MLNVFITSALVLVAMGGFSKLLAGEIFIGPSSVYGEPGGRSAAAEDIPPILLDAINYASGTQRSIAVDPRIVGGSPAPIGAYPWLVSIGVKGVTRPLDHYCAGTVISPLWVVTAAHCVYGQVKSENIQILYNTNFLNAGGESVEVDKIIVHEKWSPATFDNDIAVIKLAKNIDVAPITLLSTELSRTIEMPGRIGIVAGWGLTRDGGAISNVLRNVTVQIVGKEDCTSPASYGAAITDNMVCAGFAEGGKDSCQGDSGGTLMIPDGKGHLLFGGIVSWGEGCGRPGKYGIYTFLSNYASWVQNATKDTSIAIE